MTATTSDMMVQLAHDYETMTAPDVHVDGRLQRALVEPLQTFLNKPNPYPGMVVTTSLYLDKAKVYHPGPDWHLAMQELGAGNKPPCVASFSHWTTGPGGGMDAELGGTGVTLEIAFCAAIARVWAQILRQAGR
jgi:hypothetical protein